MSHPQLLLEPHRLTLFSLIPLNKQTAEGIVDHPGNRHLVSFVPGAKNDLNPGQVARGLNIGFQIGSKSSYTLATIGRTGDITVEGLSISRTHCSFEIHKDTEEIFLCDRSSSWSTQTSGPNALPFELDRPDRRVVVSKTVNNQFGFGGVGCNIFEFQIYWHERPSNFQEQITSRVDHPRFTRTVDDEIPTALPSKRTTRIHTPAIHTPGVQGSAKKIRYYKKVELGRGSFGEVHKAVDVDSGEFFALKLVKWPDDRLQAHQYMILKREVEASARMSHPNIVKFISAQGFGGTHLEIFTVLREGSIVNLIEKDLFLGDSKLATSLLHQMLKALDYLAFKGIVHRDVKPANILYQSLSGGCYTFQLTDFGLCNLIVDAQTFAGSPIFMAPEFYSRIPQTSKVDVWSLYVTLAYALNANEFRTKRLDTYALRVRAVQEAGNEAGFRPIQDMAIVDPKVRASAADMLDKLFNGEGRSTPRGQMQSAPEVNMNVPPPRKERTYRIKKSVTQNGRGEGSKGCTTTEKRRMPGAFQDDIVNASRGVQDRRYFT